VLTHDTPSVFISQKFVLPYTLLYFLCPLGVYLDQCCVRNKKPMLDKHGLHSGAFL